MVSEHTSNGRVHLAEVNGLADEPLFHPTIPVAVRRATGEHLADGEAEARPGVGLNGFETRYVTAVIMAEGHAAGELLEDEACELVLSTGHALSGHFYPSPYPSTERSVFVFIPSGT